MISPSTPRRRAAHGSAIRAMAKPALSVAAVAGLAGLSPQVAVAQTTNPSTAAATAAAANQVSGVDVVGTNKRRADSPKFTSSLTDTPLTVTVVPAGVIEGQNLMTLRDVLSTVPGITFGAGEGGGGYGDSINLRGYSANNDIMVDGIRDSAQYTRSDPFNLERIEVTNGASSVYSGAGSVGGSINLISKTPSLRDSTQITAGIGTAEYGRVTIDANHRLGETIAIRLNAMAHRNDVPGRDVEYFKRWGIAPSISIGLGTPTRFTLSWFHQEDDNIPQYGVPFYNGRPVPGVDRSNYYGYSNIDTQETQVDTITGLIEHDFGANLSLRNLTRWQQVTQHAIVDPPQGTYCLSNGLQPVGWSQTTAATNITGYQACSTPGLYQPSGPRGNLRDTKNTLLYNQTDLTLDLNTGGIGHTLVVGASFSAEDFRLETGNLLRNPGGATPNPVLPAMNIYAPDHIYRGPVNFIQSSASDGERQNQAVYLFDTIKLSEKFQVNGGVRWEHNQGSNRSDAYAVNGVITPGLTFESDQNLFSYRVGAVYKPQPNMSAYIAFGNSATPSQSQVNGACSAATCNVKPEKARNYEVGFKWDARGGLLSLTAAVFRNERSNYRVASGDPIIPDQVLDGSSRVDGVALGASGKLTEAWSIFANYTYLKSKVLQGASDFTAAGGVTGTERDWIKGDPLTNVPKQAFSLWSTYDVNRKLQFGYGATYQSGVYLTQHGGIAVVPATTPARFAGRTTIPLVKTEAYWVHRAMITYRVTPRLDLRLNVNNVLNETYYARGRNNGWATPGEARSAILTAGYRF